MLPGMDKSLLNTMLRQRSYYWCRLRKVRPSTGDMANVATHIDSPSQQSR
jgi:hypothetical protein